MRYVPIEKAAPGMILAYDLYDSRGRTIIGSNCALTQVYIDRLDELGYDGVYIDDEISEGIDISTMISPSLRKAGIESVKNQDIDACVNVAKAIVAEIIPQGTVSLDMVDLRSYDDYTYAHSVNVAVLCCVLGIGMNLTETDLDNVVTAALLHDLGKTCIPLEILNKPGRLTNEEYELMKTHPRHSFDLLEGKMNISAHVRQTVLLHHENVDGSGYPNGYTENEMSLLVKILHVADVYDALTSKRPYKNPYDPKDAAEYLMGAGGIMFDRDVVAQFMKLVPFYPKGMEVTLSNGIIGIVVENSEGRNLRPKVRDVVTGKDIDLSERENINVTIVSMNSPDDSTQEANEASRKEMVKAIKRKKILAVDDMATNLQMLKDILTPKYETVLVKSGEQAIRYMHKNPEVDLILMDIDMPEMTGVQAAETINIMTEGHIPILFVSSICDVNTVLMCKELNAAGYIVRPYKSVYVKSEIERILNKWGTTY